MQQAGSNLPVETNPAEFHAIRLASALNVIVIEPAGNGFDEVILSTDPKKDSGAIMVGASHSGFPIGFNDRHARWVVPGSPPSEGSNFGARVNCYAWGESVATCGCGYQQPTCGNLSNAHQPETAFTNTFNGTSAASAIIAGAALVVQGLYADRNPGVRLSVSQMRDVLSNIGTLSVGNEIGKMPDLHKIYDHFNLNQVPDGFIRDAVGDIGQTPYQGGRLSISPDIIVRKSTPLGGDPSPTPMITFGPATENRDDLGSEVEFGQDNYVYVRMKNRGAAVTQTAKAKVYYAASSSLVMPDQWVEIGTTSSVIVPSGGGLVVTPGLLWPKAKLPPVGHYCFIAVLDGTSDPAPVLPTSSVNFGWPEFIDLIRNNNNVAWRNFNVVNNQPDVMGVMKFQFFIGGAPDQQTDFDFEILREGEGITHLWLDVPLAVAKQIGRFNKLDREDGRGDETAPDYSADSSVKENYARFRLSRSMTTRLNQVTLKAKAWYECFLVAETDKQMDESKGNNRVAIRQLYQNISVGQVTWQIQPKIKGSKQDAKSGKAVLTRPKREKNR